MSFSFSVRGATKAAVFEAASAQLDDVIKGQPVHAIDKPAIEATIAKYVDMLTLSADREISLSVNGSISTVEGAVVGVGVGVQAHLVLKS